jgi:hypothetical protein
MSSILEKARSSGKYPPSLLGAYNGDEDGFETALLKILDANGTSVRPSVCCRVLHVDALLCGGLTISSY